MNARVWRVLIALGVVCLALLSWVWWQGRAAPVAILPDHVSATPSASAGPGEVFVHVAGAVKRPGLVHLPAGSRVVDAIKAVGGATSARAEGSVNLARVLVDGEQIQVASSGLSPGSSTGGKLSVNAASAQQLEDLPGVGPVLAQRIVDYRTEHGGFRSVDELKDVSGIGDALLGQLRPHVQM